MAADQVKILDGNTFVVSDQRGDIEASLTDPTGLFSFDTRFLSRWVLSVNGQRLTPLSVDDLQYFETRFFLVPGTGTVYVDAKLSVIRQRSVGDGFREELSILNHDEEPVDLTVRIEADCDFADLFEVKDALKKKGTYSKRVDDGKLLLAYQRDTFERATVISSSQPCTLDESGLTFEITIGPHGDWKTRPRRRHRPPRTAGQRRGIHTRVDRATTGNRHGARTSSAGSTPRRGWSATGSRSRASYRRSLVDLAALRFSPISAGRHSLPAAGLPWFMTMFGRDSIFTSLQALPFTPELAATTLRELGLRQGTRIDDFRDEDPGRILHEMRYGEMTAFEERPHSPYYGSRRRDTALRRATGRVRTLDRRHQVGTRTRVRGTRRAALDRRVREPPRQRVRRLSAPQRGRPGSRTSAGRTPGTRSPTVTGGFRASRARRASCRATHTTPRCAARASLVSSGTTPLSPTGSRRRPRTSNVGSTATSGWKNGEYFAIALDADGRQVDSLTSNNGHLLWSGIVDKSKAKAVVRHLMGERLFSGWGDPHTGGWRGPLQPDRLPRRDHLAVRQLLHRLGAAPLRLQGGSGRRRRRHPRGRGVLRRAPPRSIRRLPAGHDEIPGAVPHRVQPTSLVHRCPTPAAARRCSASNRSATTSWSTRPSRRPSASCNCSTSPDDGGASTPSDAAG